MRNMYSPNTAPLVKFVSLHVGRSVVNTWTLRDSDAGSILKDKTCENTFWIQILPVTFPEKTESKVQYWTHSSRTVRTVAAIQTVQIGSQTLFLKRTGWWTATDAVSVDKTVLTAIIYKKKNMNLSDKKYRTEAQLLLDLISNT